MRPAVRRRGGRRPAVRRIAASLLVALVASAAEVAVAAAPGEISTVAGTGARGYSGDGGPATRARLNGPRTVAIAPDGSILIAEASNHVVRRVDRTGTISTLAGTGHPGYGGDGGPARAALLDFPHDVAVDRWGNVLIADSANNVVRMVDSAGTISTVAGDGAEGDRGDGGPALGARLNRPKGLATDPAGSVYIADTGNHRVRRIDPAGTIATVAGTGDAGFGGDGGQATRARLHEPRGLVADATGNLYIGDRLNNRVRLVDPSGMIRTIAGTGAAGFSGDGGPATSAQFNDVHGKLALDGEGNLYVPDAENHRIRRVDRSGRITTVVGTGADGSSGDGGPAVRAALPRPRGVAVDASGNIYIADEIANRVRLVTSGAPPGAQSPPAVPASPGNPAPPAALPPGTTRSGAPGRTGYRLAAAGGEVLSFGEATLHGDASGLRLARPIVSMAGTPSGRGYRLVAADGGIFTFGDATFHGSSGGLALAQPIVGVASTPNGRGYWCVAADGGIFAFGDAEFFGSTGGIRVARPIVAMAATATGRGYRLVASDGGIFAFGDATFHGSTGSLKLSSPIVGMASVPSGRGYWIVGADGGVFAFGDASFHGSAGAFRLAQPIVGVTASPDGRGYWMVASDGGIFTFGGAPFLGSARGLRTRIVAMSD